MEAFLHFFFLQFNQCVKWHLRVCRHALPGGWGGLPPPPKKNAPFTCRRYGWFFGHGITRPGDVDLWPLNRCRVSAVARTTFLPILVFLRLFVVELWAMQTYASDWRHDRPYYLDLWPLTSQHMSVMRVTLYSIPVAKFEVRRPSLPFQH